MYLHYFPITRYSGFQEGVHSRFRDCHFLSEFIQLKIGNCASLLWDIYKALQKFHSWNMVIWQGHGLWQARRQVHLVTAITLNWQFEHAHCSSTVWMSTSLCKVRKSTRVKSSLCFENLNVVDPLGTVCSSGQWPGPHPPTYLLLLPRSPLPEVTLHTLYTAPSPHPPSSNRSTKLIVLWEMHVLL